jgi:hypothetical protein
MRKILTIAALATALVGGVAGPSFAEGDYISGPTASQSWSKAGGRTPLAGSYFAVQNRYAGGDDQYVAGPTASPSASGRTPLAGVISEFDFASQGS